MATPRPNSPRVERLGVYSFMKVNVTVGTITQIATFEASPMTSLEKTFPTVYPMRMIRKEGIMAVNVV
jgi:hypothetical protein